MAKLENDKRQQTYPNLRKIRRACNKELYRTIKRLHIWVPPGRVAEAEKLYLGKVIAHLPFIVEHSSNRKALADWWEENVCPDIAAIWNVDRERLARAFRDAFGG